VVGVDDHRDPGQPADDAPVHARLGVVGVEDVGSLPPQDAPQLGGRPQVGEQVHAPGGRAKRHVADALGLELVGVGAGGADADRVAAPVAHGPELGPQQVPQAGVDGGQMRHPHGPTLQIAFGRPAMAV
jgi:hypothetical protein